MTTYAKVTIAHLGDEGDFEELDIEEYVKRNGSEPVDHKTVRLYIVHEMPASDAPQVYEFGYFVGKFYYSQVKDMHRQPALGSGYGNYRINGRQVRLSDEDAAWITVREVPRPKNRAPVQWQGGRWMKYLKSQGWVPA